MTILKELYERRNDYTTSQEVAALLGVSDRTARKYVNLLREILEEQAAEIISKTGQGYQLTIHDPKQFGHFYQEHVKGFIPSQNITAIHESKDRQYFILNKLFFEHAHLTVEELMNELYVSKSTITNDLLEIKKILKPYDIQLRTKADKGVYTVGHEQNNRHFMMNYFFMSRLQDNIYTFSNYANFLNGISIEEIVLIVLDECRESHLRLSDFIIYNIVLHIGLAIKRIQAGFEIQLNPVAEVEEDSIEYQTAQKIVQRVEVSLQVSFPAEEAMYIALHLQNKITSKAVFCQVDYTEEEIRQQLLEQLVEVNEKTGVDLTEDSILVDGLMLHLVPLLNRLQNHTSIENPLLDQIKEQYSELLEWTKSSLAKMPVFKGYHVTESEWAYMVIHVTAAIERYYNAQKIRVVVICATGHGSSQMLEMRLEHELGSKITIERVISYYELTEEILENVDLIISSIYLPNVVFKTPLVHVSVFLNQKDIQEINHALSKFKGTRQMSQLKLPSEKKVRVNDKKNLIKQLIRPELFYFTEQTLTKEQVINELIHKLVQLETETIIEPLKTQLKFREGYSSVAFSQYLAVPHPVDPVTEEGYVAVAIVPNGVYWEKEYPEIQLVFLLSPDRANQVELDQFSKLLVPIIEDDLLRKELAACKTYEAFITRFTESIN